MTFSEPTSSDQSDSFRSLPLSSFQIAHRVISKDSGAFIIAELSGNHNNDFDLALRTLRAAKKAGADAIKLQTYTADTITIDSDLPHFQTRAGGPWSGQTLYQLYSKAATPWEWHADLQKFATDLGLIFFSSPFDFSAVDFLEKLNVPAHKIASPEITDIPLIEYVAKTGKPVIISTGIAEEEDIRLAVDACRRMGNRQVALLKCTSAYPTPLEEVNLLMIPQMAERFGTVVGLSDHTVETLIPAASVALGGRIIEKHIILDRAMGGVDSSFSLEPVEFKAMVDEVRKLEQAFGTGTFELTEKQRGGRRMARSLFAVRDIEVDEEITPENVRSIRPGLGLPPKYYETLLGKRVLKDVKAGTPMSWDLVADD